MRRFKVKLGAIGILIASLAMATSAQAALTLTAQATTDGFTLTRFYADSTQYGVLGTANTAAGNIIGAGYARGQLYLFNNVDGQSFGSQTLTVNAGFTPTSIATLGTTSYVNALGSGYFRVDQSTLALTALTLDTSFQAGYGLWANQTTGHLLASRLGSGIVDIDPLTGHVTQVTQGSFNNIFYDGVSVSSDGTIVYGADLNGGRIRGFNILTGAEVLNVAEPGRGPDGSGVISGTQYDGFVVSNNNDGTLALINPLTQAQTIIATGGARGDLVGADRSTGTLLLAVGTDVYRLGIAGGSIGGGPAVPEPATWLVMLLGFFGLGAALRRHRASPAV